MGKETSYLWRLALFSSSPLHPTILLSQHWTSVTVQIVLRIGFGYSLDWMNNTQSSDRFAFSDTALWTKTIGCKITHWVHFMGKLQDNDDYADYAFSVDLLVVGLACLQAKLLISRLQFQPIHAETYIWEKHVFNTAITNNIILILSVTTWHGVIIAGSEQWFCFREYITKSAIASSMKKKLCIDCLTCQMHL